MGWYLNLKTSVKLITAFMLVALILLGVGIYSISTINVFNRELDQMYQNNLIPIVDASEMQITFQRLRVNIRDLEGAVLPEEQQTIIGMINELSRAMDDGIMLLKASDNSREATLEAQRVETAYRDYRTGYDNAMALIREGELQQARFLLTGELRDKAYSLNGLLDEVIQAREAQADARNQQTDTLFARTSLIVIVVLILAVVISLVLGYLISRMISRPLSATVDLVAKVAAGDLRQEAQVRTRDEFGSLASSMNTMIVNLRKLIGSVADSSSSMNAASQQISASTQEMSSVNQSQAQSVESITEQFREFSSAVDTVAKSAEDASSLADQMTGTAKEGGKILEKAISGMELINSRMTKLEDDSNRIGEIIEVIDDISDQTNLLALNAAIEAARAGEQGRGFAVVADEVRKLAERSSEATKQITSIIKGMQQNTAQSVQAVNDGVQSSQQTEAAFRRIVEMIGESGFKVSEIASACEEQAAQSEEVLLSAESISAATEEASSSAHQTAIAAQQLAMTAQELDESVRLFKL